MYYQIKWECCPNAYVHGSKGRRTVIHVCSVLFILLQILKINNVLKWFHNLGSVLGSKLGLEPFMPFACFCSHQVNGLSVLKSTFELIVIWHWGFGLFISLFCDLQRFMFGGRLIFGPDVSSLFLSVFLIAGPALAFCIKILFIIKNRIKDNTTAAPWYPVLIVAIVLTVLVHILILFGSNLLFGK